MDNKTPLKIIKIGGNVIDDAGALSSFLNLFSSIEGPKILVHGGGKSATALAKKTGLDVQMVDGSSSVLSNSDPNRRLVPHF